LRKLAPLADRVLVKRVQAVTKTAGGILLPDSNVGKSNEGEVLAVGPGLTLRDGTVLKVPVAVGDKVLLPEFGGTVVKLDSKEELHLFRSDEILGKFE
jgi:chaperonin GroES